MEALVLNTEFQAVGVVDVFESLIWTDRYCGYGDFELYVPVSEQMLDLFKHDYYLVSPHSEHAMIVEAIQIESDIEKGGHSTVTGRSLESILERRIVWEPIDLGEDGERNGEPIRIPCRFEDAIKKLLSANCLPVPDDEIIIPEDYLHCAPERVIDNLRFASSRDPRIVNLEIDAQIPVGTNLYDAVISLCGEQGIGFKIVLDDNNNFVFSLYMGEDRSYDQETNPYVVFSPEYDNLLNSNYVETYVDYKNAALVVGDDDGDDQRQATVVLDNAEGLDRREVFIDASSMSWEKYDEDGDPDGYYEVEEYDEQLAQQGRETLAASSVVEAFEGEAEYRRTYEYGRDFKIGDIVQLENEYGVTAISRIVEMVFSHDGSGESAIPTFTSAEQNYSSYSVSSGSTGRMTTGKQIGEAIENIQYSLTANQVNVSLLEVEGIDKNNSVLRVYRMAGLVVVTLELLISTTFSSWTTIATGMPIPPASWFDTATTWDTTFKRGLRTVVNASGNLSIRYGVSGTYRISFSYPTIGGSDDEGGGGGGGGGTGTNNYNDLINKPQIEHNPLIGDQSFEDLGLEALSNWDIEELLS